MGLLDVLNGMQNGPRGEPAPGQGGMSKTTMALLAFLAYKAYKGMTAAQPAPAGGPSHYPEDDRAQQESPGGLAGVLKTIFGGGSMPGPVLRRGVDNTVRDLTSAVTAILAARGYRAARTSPSAPRSSSQRSES